MNFATTPLSTMVAAPWRRHPLQCASANLCDEVTALQKLPKQPGAKNMTKTAKRQAQHDLNGPLMKSHWRVNSPILLLHHTHGPRHSASWARSNHTTPPTSCARSAVWDRTVFWCSCSAANFFAASCQGFPFLVNITFFGKQLPFLRQNHTMPKILQRWVFKVTFISCPQRQL